MRKILLVSRTAKKTNEWVLNKAGVKRKLLETVKARKLAHCGHTMRKQGSCLEKEIMQGTMPGARMRGRPHTTWMDNIKTWTGLPVVKSIRMTEGRDKWRNYVHGVANPWSEDGKRTFERNTISYVFAACYDITGLVINHYVTTFGQFDLKLRSYGHTESFFLLLFHMHHTVIYTELKGLMIKIRYLFTVFAFELFLLATKRVCHV